MKHCVSSRIQLNRDDGRLGLGPWLLTRAVSERSKQYANAGIVVHAVKEQQPITAKAESTISTLVSSLGMMSMTMSLCPTKLKETIFEGIMEKIWGRIPTRGDNRGLLLLVSLADTSYSTRILCLQWDVASMELDKVMYLALGDGVMYNV